MARLIDVDNLIDELEELSDSYVGSCSDFAIGIHNICRQQGVDAAIEVVRKQKSVDPVKHGRWIHVDELPSGGYFKCSECNRQIFLNFEWKVSFENPADEYRYCPGCGARMDGDAND